MNKNFKIGADPEFACIDPTCDEIVESGENFSEEDKVGADGGGVAFEIRPAPSTSPVAVVRNIRSLFLGH